MNISKIAGPNTKTPVQRGLQCGSGAEPKQGLGAHPTWLRSLRWIPDTHRADPGVFLVFAAFPW